MKLEWDVCNYNNGYQCFNIAQYACDRCKLKICSSHYYKVHGADESILGELCMECRNMWQNKIAKKQITEVQTYALQRFTRMNSPLSSVVDDINDFQVVMYP